jgi:predicted permease
MGRWWKRGHRFENEMSEELAFHIEARERELIAEGVAPDEAARRARVAFGNLTRVSEEARRMPLLNWLEDFGRDVRFGWRSMRRAPVLTAVAVASLALGIGANTAIFSVLHTVFWKSLPLDRPEDLRVLNFATDKWPRTYVKMGMGHADQGQGKIRFWSFPYALVEKWKALPASTLEVAAYQSFDRASLVYQGKAQRARGALVDGSYFRTLAVGAFRGRTILEEDDRPEANPVVVLSYRYWIEQFVSDPAVVGSPLKLNNSTFTIIGIAPPGFFGLDLQLRPDVFVPLRHQKLVEPNWSNDFDLFSDQDVWWVQVASRKNPAATEAQFRTAVDTTFAQMVPAKENTSDDERPRLEIAPGDQGYAFLKKEMAVTLWVAMGAVGLVLLIACANIANLLLARAVARRKESAVRLALGAGRLRLMRQALAESLLLSAIGGVCGWLIAMPLLPLLLNLTADANGAPLTVTTDWRVFAFAAGVTLLTGFLFGLLPAWQSSRANLETAMKEQGRSIATNWTGRWSAGRLLVIGQIGLSLVLLTGAVLCGRTLVNLKKVSLGFNAQQVLLFTTDAAQPGYGSEKLNALHRQLAERLESLPGVTNVSYSSFALLSNAIWEGALRRPDQPKQKDFDFENATRLMYVGPQFLETMQIRLLAGRSVEEQDSANRPKVVVLNETAVRRLFGNRSPLGQIVLGEQDEPYTVVGVAANAMYSSVREKAGYPPTAYLPLAQSKQPWSVHFELRTAGDPLALADAVRKAVREVDPNLSVYEMRTQQRQIETNLQSERQFAWLSSSFGGLALLLCAIGLYGVVSYSVSRRTMEIGLRMALGADRSEVVALVMRETLWLLVPGVVAGLIITLIATRALEAKLYGLPPHDPISIAAALVFLLIVGVLSAWLPARRAASLDPVTALRHE